MNHSFTTKHARHTMPGSPRRKWPRQSSKSGPGMQWSCGSRQSGMRSPLRNMCGQLRNNAVWNMKVRTWNWHPFTILLGQKTRKSPKSFFGCLKNQRFSQIRSDLYMQNHRAENRFGAVVLSCVGEWKPSSQPRTHFWVPGMCELRVKNSANIESYICFFCFVSDRLTTILAAGRHYIWH